jgi:hypothetical protein
MVKAFQKVSSAFSRAGNKIKKNVCLCAAKLSAASRFWLFVNTEQCPKCKVCLFEVVRFLRVIFPSRAEFIFQFFAVGN